MIEGAPEYRSSYRYRRLGRFWKASGSMYSRLLAFSILLWKRKERAHDLTGKECYGIFHYYAKSMLISYSPFVHPSFPQRLSMHVVSFTILTCANKILTLSYITVITEVFLESIHQRQTKHSWVSHFTLNSVECLTSKDLPGSEEGRDEANGGNECFFSDWETREGDGQQQRGWRVKGDWRKVKWKVKGKWRLGDKQWTSLAFTMQSRQTAAGKVPVSPSCWNGGCSLTAHGKWWLLPWADLRHVLINSLEVGMFTFGFRQREAALSSSGGINVYLQRCSVLITSSLFH